MVLSAYRSPLLAGSSGSGSSGGSEITSAYEAGINGGDTLGIIGDALGTGGGGGAQLATALRPALDAACPAVLQAVPSLLPSVGEVAASPALRAQYGRLLDVGLLLVEDAGSSLAALLPHGQWQGRAAAAAGVAAPVGGGAAAAAARLSGVLRGLKQLLGPDLVGSPGAPASGPGSRDLDLGQRSGPAAPDRWATLLPGMAADASASTEVLGAAAAAATAAAGPLVPAAVARDLLQALSSLSAHVLVPLQWAAVAGMLAPGPGAGAAALALPACSIVRELAASLPEEVLLASPRAADGGSDGALARPMNGHHHHRHHDHHSGLSAESRGSEGGWPQGPAADIPAASVAACVVEAILLLASACAPYTDAAAAGSSSGSSAGGGSEAGPGGMAGVSGLPGPPQGSELGAAAGGREAEAALADQCVVQLLAAAQALVKRWAGCWGT